eukprot:1364677-Prymnesium_polylepis.1
MGGGPRRLVLSSPMKPTRAPRHRSFFCAALSRIRARAKQPSASSGRRGRASAHRHAFVLGALHRQGNYRRGRREGRAGRARGGGNAAVDPRHAIGRAVEPERQDGDRGGAAGGATAARHARGAGEG